MAVFFFLQFQNEGRVFPLLALLQHTSSNVVPAGITDASSFIVSSTFSKISVTVVTAVSAESIMRKPYLCTYQCFPHSNRRPPNWTLP